MLSSIFIDILLYRINFNKKIKKRKSNKRNWENLGELREQFVDNQHSKKRKRNRNEKLKHFIRYDDVRCLI